MEYCITVPELTITSAEVEELRNFFYLQKSKFGRTYVSEGNIKTELTIVDGYEKSKLIKKIESAVNSDIINASYFVSNYGIQPHIDDNRQCILSFEIQNTENVATNFHLDTVDLDTVESRYYNKIPLMWNPQIRHSANISVSERIFFQIELDRQYNFSYYIDMYNNRRLFNYV